MMKNIDVYYVLKFQLSSWFGLALAAFFLISFNADTIPKSSNEVKISIDCEQPSKILQRGIFYTFWNQYILYFNICYYQKILFN